MWIKTENTLFNSDRFQQISVKVTGKGALVIAFTSESDKNPRWLGLYDTTRQAELALELLTNALEDDVCIFRMPDKTDKEVNTSDGVLHGGGFSARKSKTTGKTK